MSRKNAQNAQQYVVGSLALRLGDLAQHIAFFSSAPTKQRAAGNAYDPPNNRVLQSALICG
jgi:hypothetical protein